MRLPLLNPNLHGTFSHRKPPSLPPSTFPAPSRHQHTHAHLIVPPMRVVAWRHSAVEQLQHLLQPPRRKSALRPVSGAPAPWEGAARPALRVEVVASLPSCPDVSAIGTRQPLLHRSTGEHKAGPPLMADGAAEVLIDVWVACIDDAG